MRNVEIVRLRPGSGDAHAACLLNILFAFRHALVVITDPSSENQHIRVIVLDALVRRVGVVAQAGTVCAVDISLPFLLSSELPDSTHEEFKFFRRTFVPPPNLRRPG